MDDIQSEVQEVATQETSEPSPAAVETASTEATPAGDAGAGTGDSITLDANGEVNLPDSIFDSDLDMQGRPAETTPKVDAAGVTIRTEPAAAYTPEQMAQAFMTNTIDSTRVPEAMKGYYDAIMAEQQRAAQLQQIVTPPQQMRPLQRPQPPDQTIRPLQFTPDMFRQLQEGGKQLAAKYLGIQPDDFNEYEASHQQAYTLALQDLKNKANEIHVADQQKRLYAANQAYQQQLQQYGQYSQAVRAQQLRGMVNEFSKDPDWVDIDKNFYPKWKASLPPQHQRLVDGVIQQGNIEQVKKVMDVVRAAYSATKGRAAPVQGRARPPVIMNSGGEADMREVKGMADTSKLESMSPEERAEWLINNKFV